MKTYSEPTYLELEDAQALVFLDAVKTALTNVERVHGLTLTLTVNDRDRYGNRERRVIAHDRNGDVVGDEKGTYVHPRTGDPTGVAWSIAINYRAARKRAE